MIVQRIRLHPFAGLTDRDVAFQRGLNVVLGPNEAGKSTLVNALKLCLFQPTKYYKRTWDNEISRYLPVGGGDTIQVELIFAAADRSWTLRKAWGGTCRSELECDGQLITEDAAVDGQLRDLLVRKQGSYENVLIAYQSHMPDSLSRLAENAEQTEDFANLLRKAAFETDGVSIEAMSASIEEQLKEQYERWDLDAGRPEGGRGLENRWRRGVGKLLDAWYRRESVKRALAAARAHEELMDAVNAEIGRLEAEVEDLSGFVDQNRAVIEAARSQRVLAAEKKALEVDYGTLAEINHRWPALEENLRQHQKEHETHRKRVEVLGEELERAEAHSQSRSLVERFSRAAEKKEKVAETSRALEEAKTIDPARLAELVEENKKLEQTRISLEAGRMTLEFHAQEQIELRVQRDLQIEEDRALDRGETIEVRAGGRIEIRHADWSLTARSGDADFEQLQRRHQAAEERARALLSELECGDVDEATRASEAGQSNRKQLARLQSELEEILDGRSYDELEASARKVAEIEVPRPVQAVVQDLTDEKTRLQAAKGALSAGQEQVGAWQAAYGSKDGVLERLVEKKAELGGKTRELEKLAPLLAGAEDTEALIAGYDAKKRALEGASSALSDKKIERAGLVPPDQTQEELAEELTETESDFLRIEERGESLRRVQIAFEAARTEMDAETLDPWLGELEQIVTPLTDGRYRTVRLEEKSWGVACRPDEAELPYELLSLGTRSCLGLAVRLSMARHFLQGLGGFVVLDDPLVDMDPARQQAACEILRRFAEDKQVIVLTCHPRHEQLLQGNRIELGQDV